MENNTSYRCKWEIRLVGWKLHPRWELWKYFIRKKTDDLRGKGVTLQTEREILRRMAIMQHLLYLIALANERCCFYSIFLITHDGSFSSSDSNTGWKARPATWWIATDYRPRLFYLKCILSNPLLFDLETDPLSVLAGRPEALRQPKGKRSVLRLNLQTFVFPPLGMCKRMNRWRVCECTRIS